MAQKQTRRSISVSRKLYDRANGAALAIGVPLSQLTEFALREVVDARDKFASLQADKVLERNRADA